MWIKGVIILFLVTIYNFTEYCKLYSVTNGNYLPSHQTEKCDTINIDECFIARNGELLVLDTIVEDEINGYFTIVRAEPLDLNYCMLYAERIDTSYSSRIYNVLVENKEEIKGSLQDIIESYLSEDKKGNRNTAIPLRLCRFYSIEKSIIGLYEKNDYKKKISVTVSCERCHVIILHGKEELIYDCPLYNNLYRLK